MRARLVSRACDPAGDPGGAFRSASLEEIVIGGASLIIERSWDSLHEASVALGLPELAPGDTRVWFAIPAAGPCLPVFSSDLLRTHVPLGDVASSDPDLLALALQARRWSPNGEGESMVARLAGPGRGTSFGFGDAIQIGSSVSILGDGGWDRVTIVPDGGGGRHAEFAKTIRDMDVQTLVHVAARQRYMLELARLVSGDEPVHAANLRACAREAAARGFAEADFMARVGDRYVREHTDDGMPRIEDDYIREAAIRIGTSAKGLVPDEHVASLMTSLLKVRSGGNIVLIVPHVDRIADSLSSVRDANAGILARDARRFAQGLLAMRG